MLTLDDVLVEAGAWYPDDIVVEGLVGKLTYADLDAQASRVAEHLIARGLAAGARVGIWMNGSLAVLPALFGVLRAGAVCVPVRADDTTDRRNQVVDALGVEMVLTGSTNAHTSIGLGVAVPAVSMDALLAMPVNQRIGLPHIAQRLNAFAFAMFNEEDLLTSVVFTHAETLSSRSWLQQMSPLFEGQHGYLDKMFAMVDELFESNPADKSIVTPDYTTGIRAIS